MKKRLSVLVLALAMVLTMSASVFAAGQNSGKNDGADSYSATEAKLVKYVQVAEGVTLPTTTFTFQIAPVADADKTANNYTVPAASHPTKYPTVTVSQISGSTNYTGNTAISSIFAKADFPRAGEYTFTVKEVKDNTGAALTDADGWTYAKDTYTLRLIVDKDGNIDDVTVQPATGEKVDPTDVDPEEDGEDQSPTGSEGGFTFTNNYTKLVDTHFEPDPDNPGQLKEVSGALKVEKEVTGEYADYTKDWAFTAAVTIPEDTMGYTLADHTPSDTALKNGESFVYDVLPAGSKITITETEANAGGYTTTFAGTKQSVANATEFVLTEDGQFVKVTNAFDDTSITPTGIIINNLPYVLLIGLAIGGIVLFSRKKRYE